MAPRSTTRSAARATRSFSLRAAASRPWPGTCRWCPLWSRRATRWRRSTTGGSRPRPHHRRPTAWRAWPPTRWCSSITSDGWSRCASSGTPWAGGSPRRWSSTGPSGSAPPRSWGAPTRRRPGRWPSPRSSATWPASTTTCRRSSTPPRRCATCRPPTFRTTTSSAPGCPSWVTWRCGPTPGGWASTRRPSPGRPTRPAPRAGPTVRVPCLVLAFEHDVDSPPRYARQAAETIPGCVYREVAGSGHIGILTHADAVAAFLVAFFEQH